MLLQHNADPTMDTEFNKDARQIAEKHGHTAIVKLLEPLCPEKEPKDDSGLGDDAIAEIIRKAIAEAEVEVAREDAEEEANGGGKQGSGMFNFAALDEKLANTVGGLVSGDMDSDEDDSQPSATTHKQKAAAAPMKPTPTKAAIPAPAPASASAAAAAATAVSETMVCIPAGEGKLGLSLGVKGDFSNGSVFVKGLNSGLKATG